MLKTRPARLLVAAAFAASIATLPGPALAQGGSSAGMSTTGAYLAGRIAAFRSELGDAAGFYRIVFDRNPSDLTLASNILSLWVEAGRVERAEPLADAILSVDPGYEPGRLVLATVAFADGEFARAEVQVSAIAGDTLTQAAARVLSAWAEVGLGNVDEAIAKLTEGPQATLFDAFHASLIADMSDRPEVAVAMLGSVYAPQSSQRMTEAYIRQLARAGRADEAIELASGYLVAVPGHPAIAPLLAQLEAGEPIAPMIETPQQGAAELLYGVGSSLVASDELGGAVVYLQLARHIGQNGDFGTLLLGQILQSQRRFAESVEAFDAIPPDSPLYVAAAVSASISDQVRGESDAALERLEPIVAANPTDGEAATTLADLYRAVGRFEDAELVLTPLIESLKVVGADDWQLYFGRGISYERTGRWELAEADFRQALELAPGQPDVLNYLGYSWIDRGENFVEAFDMIQSAVSQRPSSGHIIDSLGWAYYRLGNYELAVDTLVQAVLLVPYQPEILDHLGDAYWRVGRRLEAVHQWNHALFYDPEEDLADEIRDKIENGLPELEDAPAGGVIEIR